MYMCVSSRCVWVREDRCVTFVLIGLPTEKSSNSKLKCKHCKTKQRRFVSLFALQRHARSHVISRAWKSSLQAPAAQRSGMSWNKMLSGALLTSELGSISKCHLPNYAEFATLYVQLYCSMNYRCRRIAVVIAVSSLRSWLQVEACHEAPSAERALSKAATMYVSQVFKMHIYSLSFAICAYENYEYNYALCSICTVTVQAHFRTCWWFDDTLCWICCLVSLNASINQPAKNVFSLTQASCRRRWLAQSALSRVNQKRH